MMIARKLQASTRRLLSSLTESRPNIDIYFRPESPPCRTVEMVAEIVGVGLNKHIIDLFKREHHADKHVQINPRRKIPFLIDGPVKIGESRAISRYLANRYKPNDKHLYPSDPVRRAQIDDMLDFELGTLYASAFRLLSQKLVGPVEVLDEREDKNFNHALRYLDQRLAEVKDKNKFLFGDGLTIADISLAATFTFPVACDYNLSNYKHILGYLDRLKASIPKYSEINDEPTESLRNWIVSRQES